jgi:hypothetical protein
MQFSVAARSRLLALTLGLGATGLALSGCGTVDDALFGANAPAPAPAAEVPAPAEAAPAPEASPPPADTDNTAPATAAPAPTPPPEGLQLATIEPGTDTGTSVGQTVQRLRGELSGLRDKIAADVQQYITLKSASVEDVTTYQEAKSHIIIRLQTGTTKANPELVNQWNTSQSALDTLTSNINSFTALGTDLGTDGGRAHTEHATISDTLNMAGATDEDHRQLMTLQSEASQIAGVIDRLQADVSRIIRRQTAFVAIERGNLTTLQSDIKNGELYTSAAAPAEAVPASAQGGADAGRAIATIKFAKAKTDYEQDLYTALNKQLQAKPGTTFRVEAVSPTRGSEAAMQKAQSEAQHHAQEVLKSMTDMGVPAARVSMSSSTDPSVASVEVRVYAK